MCASGGVSAPQRTPEEVELQRAEQKRIEEEMKLRQMMFAEQKARWALEDMLRRRAEEEQAAIEPYLLKSLRLKKTEIPMTEEEQRLLSIPRTIKVKKTREKLVPLEPGDYPREQQGASFGQQEIGQPWKSVRYVGTPGEDPTNWVPAGTDDAGAPVYMYRGPNFVIPGSEGAKNIRYVMSGSQAVPVKVITEEYEEEEENPEFPGIDKLPYQKYRYEPMTEEEYVALMTPEEKEQYDLQKMAMERQLKAMKGELPVDPEVEEALEEARSAAHEGLYRQLGPGYATSSPGLERLARLNTQMGLLKSAVRHGEMDTAQAIATSRGEIQSQAQKLQSSLAEQPFRSATSKLGLFTGGVGSSRPVSYEGLLSQLAQDRMAQMQADLYNTQQANLIRGQNLSAIAGLLGTLGGIYGGKYYNEWLKARKTPESVRT